MFLAKKIVLRAITSEAKDWKKGDFFLSKHMCLKFHSLLSCYNLIFAFLHEEMILGFTNSLTVDIVPTRG